MNGDSKVGREGRGRRWLGRRLAGLWWKPALAACPVPCRIYWVATVVVGWSLLGIELLDWQSTGVARYLAYFLAFVVASRFCIKLPGAAPTMSVNQVLVLVGVLELSLPETALMAAAGALLEAPQLAALGSRASCRLLRGAMAAVAATVTYRVYHSGLYRLMDSSAALMIILAAALLFLLNTLPMAWLIRATRHEPFLAVWRRFYPWSFAHYLVAASIALLWTVSTRSLGWQTSLLMLPALFVMYRAYNLQLERAETGEQHAREVAELHLKTIEALAAAIEAKDDTTRDHLERVQIYALEIGKRMHLSKEELQALRVASMLHDIGKLAVPEYIISKPGRLTQEEFEKMKIHPVVGAQILERVRFPYPVAPIVRHHHEKWDGTGYPDGLKGEQIPVGARILAVVDGLDAVASDRHYHRAIPLEQAMEVISRKAGTSYDPQVVEILRRHYREWEARVRAHAGTGAKIRTDLRIDRGEAPDTGLEQAEEISSPPAGRRPKKDRDFPAVIGAARRQEQALYELGRILAFSKNRADCWAVLDAGLRSMIPYDTLCVYVRDKKSLQAVFARGQNAALFGGLRVPLGEGLVGWVAENRKPIINGNPSVEVCASNDGRRFGTLSSALAVPLESGTGLVGVLSLYHSAGANFTRNDLRVLLRIAPKVSAVLEDLATEGPWAPTVTTDLIALAGRTDKLPIRAGATSKEREASHPG